MMPMHGVASEFVKLVGAADRESIEADPAVYLGTHADALRRIEAIVSEAARFKVNLEDPMAPVWFIGDFLGYLEHGPAALAYHRRKTGGWYVKIDLDARALQEEITRRRAALLEQESHMRSELLRAVHPAVEASHEERSLEGSAQIERRDVTEDCDRLIKLFRSGDEFSYAVSALHGFFDDLVSRRTSAPGDIALVIDVLVRRTTDALRAPDRQQRRAGWTALVNILLCAEGDCLDSALESVQREIRQLSLDVPVEVGGEAGKAIAVICLGAEKAGRLPWEKDLWEDALRVWSARMKKWVRCDRGRSRIIHRDGPWGTG